MNTKLIAVAVLAALAIASVHAGEQPTPGFNHKIPEEILTPDTVKTRIGTLEFVDGVPTAEIKKVVIDLNPGQLSAEDDAKVKQGKAAIGAAR